MDTKISKRTPIKWWINRQPKAIAQTGIGYIAVANYKEEDDAIPCVEFSEYESTVNKLEAENARLREALEFYSIPNKTDEFASEDFGPYPYEDSDFKEGHIAREALRGDITPDKGGE